MPKLWLVFKDENGSEKRVEVERTPFTVGRHSACSLTILDGRLSREHLLIDRDTEKFVVSDPGSSNGTTLNGEKLSSAVGLKNKDKLNLGGGIEIEIVAEEGDGAAPAPPSEPEAPAPGGDAAAPDAASAGAAAVPAGGAVAAASASEPPGGIPTAFFILAPLLGLFVLAIVIGAVFLFGGGDDQRTVSTTGEYDHYNENDDVAAGNEDDDNDTPRPVKSPTPVASGTVPLDGPIVTASPTSGGTEIPTGGDTSETAKVERNGAAFLRQAATNDQRAFLTTEQAAAVSAVVKRIGRSASLAANINSARKNSAGIKSLAAAKGLKPQFLAIAAITKLGDGRGDALQAAESIVDVYDKLAIQVNNENSDDVLLLVAAYDQGVAGDFRKLRDLLQQLAKKEGAPVSRELRTIWYLEKSGNLARADYERALNFLAIGTIAQNPKEFGVNAEALKL